MKKLNVVFGLLCLSSLAHADRLVFAEGKSARFDNVESSLQIISDELGLGINAQEFKVVDMKKSLLGDHTHFQQFHNGWPIEGAELVISSQDGRVTKAFNNGMKSGVKTTKAFLPLVSEEAAIESAWKHLKVNGELLTTPDAELVYTQDLQLVYKINLGVSSPYGHYIVLVDAAQCKVVKVQDAALARRKNADTDSHPRLTGDVVSYQSALNQHNQKNLKEKSTLSFRVDGSAQVFDPNPVVTLARTDLQDQTPANQFTQAYRNEDLKEITFSNGVYSLKGPKVTIQDWDSPSSAPSTSADGSWIFERNTLQFTDVMTYFHLDRSIRYLESLGFVGAKAIFKKSLEVDANGANGADNSYYHPGSRKLSFGHGCVDDNEDAEVILHELGHAIQHHISSSWAGGDTGAMGEGFGDYWAASYTYTTAGGQNTQPNWVFKWDGHNSCWPGRKLNSMDLKYSATQTYSAHARIGTGVSDEIWSTPVFQAFMELYNKGVKRSDIDKIIIEAHFGLGSGIKMPEMAKAIVKAAKALFPDKDYDQVYTRHFKNQNIL